MQKIKKSVRILICLIIVNKKYLIVKLAEMWILFRIKDREYKKL
jgi:hypothetical protein